MTTALGGVVGTVTTLPLQGRGGVTGVSSVGGVIDDTFIGQGQVIPNATTITSMSVRFSASNAVTLIGSTVTIAATLYVSPVGGDTYTATAVTCNAVPVLTGFVAVGTILSGTCTGLNQLLASGSTAFVAVSATAAGLSLINIVSGYVAVSMTAT